LSYNQNAPPVLCLELQSERTAGADSSNLILDQQSKHTAGADSSNLILELQSKRTAGALSRPTIKTHRWCFVSTYNQNAPLVLSLDSKISTISIWFNHFVVF
jgi:hypothetical protein